MPLLKIFFVCVEIAIVVAVAVFFMVEGFGGSLALNVILLFLSTSALANLIAAVLESRKRARPTAPRQNGDDSPR